MQTKANLQDLFLLRARRDKLPVTMFLMNGFQMRGTIAGFDAFVVVLDSDGRQQIIYKHAISTIAPVRPVDLEGGTGRRGRMSGLRTRFEARRLKGGT
ncbi:MAG: RNA chaperone Hfq [Dysosmobacter welbionis]